MFQRFFCLLSLVLCLFFDNRVGAEPVQHKKSHNYLKHELVSMVNSFMSGLQPDTPKQAVELWILGMKNRSGAVQYATLSPNLQEQTRNLFEQKNWGTGQSSPWVDNVRFVKEEMISQTKVRYIFEYDLVTSNKYWGKGRKTMTVKKNPKRIRPYWYITEITTKYNQYEAFTPAEEVIR